MSPSPILVVMAAGIGSRFGGLKQLAAFGQNGECIIDYSLYDACRAGFRRVVFIVNDAILDEFRQKIGKNAEARMEVRYVCQRPDTLPPGCTPPQGRSRPWGTGHAVMCCREVIDAPFAAINGDDFYGRDAFGQIYGFLSGNPGRGEYAMVGYPLKNTLSDNGFVSRGVCQVDEGGMLQSITERTHIISTCDGPMYTLDEASYTRLPEDAPVSMNLWGFAPDFAEELWARFPAFYAEAMGTNPLKAEYFLPFVVNDMLQEGRARVRLLPTQSKWYGVTYQQDAPLVKAGLTALTEAGEYPPALWK